jgi:hypothetical protein
MSKLGILGKTPFCVDKTLTGLFIFLKTKEKKKKERKKKKPTL